MQELERLYHILYRNKSLNHHQIKSQESEELLDVLKIDDACAESSFASETELIFNKVLRVANSIVADTFTIIEKQAQRELQQTTKKVDINKSELKVSTSSSSVLSTCITIRDATLRSTFDIDASDSKVICKIPAGIRLKFDQEKKLYAGLDEDIVDVVRFKVCVSVKQIDMWNNKSGDRQEEEKRQTSIGVNVNNDVVVGDGWVRGWISLTGRTVDDYAPICRIITPNPP